MIRFSKFLLLLWATSSLISCSKDDDDPKVETVKLSESIEPYKFQTGSYWVYENDATKDLDSVVVLGTVQDVTTAVIKSGSLVQNSSEYFQMNLKSFFNDETYNYYILNNTIKINGGGQWGENGQPIHIPGSDLGGGFNGMEVVEKISSIKINGNEFLDVDKIKITDSLQYQAVFDNTTYLYFKDDVGLIKKEIETDSGTVDTWNLIRWNVIK